MRIIDGSSDVCSSDLIVQDARAVLQGAQWTVALEIKGGDAIDTFNAVAAACFTATQTCPSQRLAILRDARSEERRGGKECGSQCRSRWSPSHTTRQNIANRERQL